MGQIMGRKKKTIQYTVKDHPGLLIEVESPQDSDAARQKALDEIIRRIEEEEEELSQDSFPNGLGIDDLILVDSPRSITASPNRELQPVELAAKKIAQLAQARRELEKNQENFQQYLPLIDALFKPEKLTSEQQEQIQNKSFAKSLEELASSKVEYDALAPDAKDAWELLKPVAVGLPLAESEAEETAEPLKHNGNKRQIQATVSAK